MFRRLLTWFRRPPSLDDVFEPPFDLLWDGLIDRKPKQILGEDRFRVGIFPALCDGKPDPGSYWLDFQFRSGRRWNPMLCLHESKLDIVRDVLHEVDRWLDERHDRPHHLPKIKLGDRRFYVDSRLCQLRNVQDPNDFYDIR
jgi:hypothetical protein